MPLNPIETLVYETMRRGDLPRPQAVIPPPVETVELRDLFAMAALTGLLASGWRDVDRVAERAYFVADEMLRARDG